MGEEIIFKNGVRELSLYDDRTHSYLTPEFDLPPFHFTPGLDLDVSAQLAGLVWQS